jgi:hypothetical protein
MIRTQSVLYIVPGFYVVVAKIITPWLLDLLTAFIAPITIMCHSLSSLQLQESFLFWSSLLFNLTVTQGMINSLVVYANVIWAYQDIRFPTGFGKALISHKTFIAWLNLDFGIETCFFHDMNAYSKAWLQFVFPIYTAGLFLLGLHYSSKLSTLFENRSISTLATLLFLSYSKLLRAIIACLQLVTYYTYNDSNADRFINIVWAIDGNYSYGQHPHIFLLLIAIACFVLLWIPYTLLLFSMQWLRSVDHLGPLKFIGRYKPLYDAYFAPLRDKHHYWFGLLLLNQGLLLLVSSLTLYQKLVCYFCLLFQFFFSVTSTGCGHTNKCQ